jgi:hypothetical protein
VGHDPDIADLGQVGLNVDSHVGLSELSEPRSVIGQLGSDKSISYQR